MTPQEKAKELYDKYEKLFLNANADSWSKEASNCVLMLVDEILNELNQLHKPEYTTFITRYAESSGDAGESMDGYEKINFWEDVKDNIA